MTEAAIITDPTRQRRVELLINSLYQRGIELHPEGRNIKAVPASLVTRLDRLMIRDLWHDLIDYVHSTEAAA